MGFKVMPHFNYWACDYKHPLLHKLRDWQVRDVYRNEPQGWNWLIETDNQARLAYIHPGLALWRRILVDAVLRAHNCLETAAIFLDQTLCTWNTGNGLVENMTTIEGMRQLQEELVSIQPDIVIAGEGLNEISFQRQCFAQAHIYRPLELKPHHIQATPPICSYLWNEHTRLVGYHHLDPADKNVDIGIEVYRRMGTIPTLIPTDLTLISTKHPVIKKLLELAAGQDT